MTPGSILLAYAALGAASSSGCFTGLYEKFDVQFYHRADLLSKTISYRDEQNPEMIFVNEFYTKDHCDLAGSIAYLSAYKNIARAFPEEKYPVRKLAEYFGDQAKNCCQKH